MAKMTQNELLQLIKDADEAYYNQSKPIMTDKEYDGYRRLYIMKYGKKDLDYVPDTVSSDFEKYQHPVPLLSLDKIHNDDPEIEKKLKRFLEKCNNVVIQPKIDGLTVASVPQEDGSCLFVTRGRNGIEGEVLPRFVSKLMKPGINNSGYTLRGEAYITDSNFRKILELQDELGLERFKNSRNAASGILRDTKKSQFLQYIDYTVYEIPGSNKTVSEQLSIIFNTGFKSIAHVIVDNITVKQLIKLIEKKYEQWSSEDIPIDGVVIKYNEQGAYTKYGCTGHHPNNALAWKATADEYETKVMDITWQVGKDSVTPVAELEPIEIDGTTVSRATLHNLGFFNDMGLHEQDTVVICKSGEIIPKVLRVSSRSNCKKFSAPTVCPSCGEELSIITRKEKNRTISSLVCENSDCPERRAQAIAFIAQKDVLDINGLSLQKAKKIVDYCGTDCDERVIFNLSVEDILSMPGFKEKSAQNLYDAIQDSLKKEISIGILVRACCFSGIGDTVGNALEKEYGTVDNIISNLPFPDRLKSINGIGDKTAEIISSPEFITKLSELYQVLNVKEKIEGDIVEEKLAASGTNWVITGKFVVGNKHIVREELEEMIRSVGGTVQSSIKKDTDYLLVADVNTASTKAQKAKKNGVRLVTYEFLLGLTLA